MVTGTVVYELSLSGLFIKFNIEYFPEYFMFYFSYYSIIKSSPVCLVKCYQCSDLLEHTNAQSMRI